MRTRHQDRPATIYFIRLIGAESAAIKIGVTFRMGERMRALAKEYGHEVEVLAVMRGSWNDEQALHDRFQEYRHRRTEWFEPSEEILTFIKTRCRAWEPGSRVPGVEPCELRLTYRLDDLRWLERAAAHANVAVGSFIDDAIAYYANRVGFPESRPPVQLFATEINIDEDAA